MRSPLTVIRDRRDAKAAELAELRAHAEHAERFRAQVELWAAEVDEKYPCNTVGCQHARHDMKTIIAEYPMPSSA